MNQTLIQLISFTFSLLNLLILARVILSWIQIDPYRNSTFYRFKLLIFQITEPMIAPIQRMLPATGGLDWSPFILIILFMVLEQVLLSLLR
jgi:YggT family protein